MTFIHQYVIKNDADEEAKPSAESKEKKSEANPEAPAAENPAKKECHSLSPVHFPVNPALQSVKS